MMFKNLLQKTVVPNHHHTLSVVYMLSAIVMAFCA